MQYARFRSGNCSFVISSEGDSFTEWVHSFTFDTHSNGKSAHCKVVQSAVDHVHSVMYVLQKLKVL